VGTPTNPAIKNFSMPEAAVLRIEESNGVERMSRTGWIRLIAVIVLAVIALLLIRLHVAGGQAQGIPGDASKGQRLASAWCAECHAVGAKVFSAQEDAPSFLAIAQLPSTTALSLNAFLRSNHRSMPNLMIARTDADDIVAYILSLKRK
jgi:mono/diheme cytochrome c family protein